jgi:serine/threonine-protein kinase
MLAGKYRVEEVLGVGNMGAVVAATHVDLMEKRAIKFLLPANRDNLDLVERFLREARAAVKLKSQHAVKVQDVSRFESGEPYMVMEYLEGEDLRAIANREKVLAPSRVVGFLLQALDAIDEAHTLGIIHRDLKPANIFLATGARGVKIIKVLDFGISKISNAGVDMTGTADVLGTPAYMPPEQMRSSRNVDLRADIWALGVIAYELLAGTRPFIGKNMMDLVVQAASKEPPPPSTVQPNIPVGLDAVVLRCLSKDREARYPSAAALAEALAPFDLGPDK